MKRAKNIRNYPKKYKKNKVCYLKYLEVEEEEEQQMESWIQEVQKYTGLSQHVINSLLTVEYEGSPDQ